MVLVRGKSRVRDVGFFHWCWDEDGRDQQWACCVSFSHCQTSFLLQHAREAENGLNAARGMDEVLVWKRCSMTQCC